MRQPGKNNRQRGRGRRNGGGQINRNTTIDSNGPDVRLRGNALQLTEKYTSLGNDASAAGERISAEAYYQYADHYFRVQSSIVAAQEERREKHQDHRQSADQAKAHDNKAQDDAGAEAEETSSGEAETVEASAELEVASAAETVIKDSDTTAEEDTTAASA